MHLNLALLMKWSVMKVPLTRPQPISLSASQYTARKSYRVCRRASSMLALAGALALATLGPVTAADQFRQLKGAEIRARLTGMELTDGIHWTYVFRSDGRMSSIELGKRAEGSWSVRKDELCIKIADASSPCSQVWAAGQRIQLRRRDELPEDATLQRPQKRT